MHDGEILYPEDKIPFRRLVPLGMQHVVAMFGATVLAPVIMNFDPQLALFFSGVGTLIFLAMTRLKVPSYLGSSFSFIGPVLAVTGGNPALIPDALCGVAAAAVLYALAGWATMRWGSAWIDALMPPIVTGTVVAIIGLNLASSAVANAVNADFSVRDRRDLVILTVALVTFFTAALVSIHARGFMRLLPVLAGVVVGYVLAAACGLLDAQALAAIHSAGWIGVPPFVTPRWSGRAVLVIAPIFVVLVAENKGHIAAISAYLHRDLSPHLGRAYLGDATATFISALGGGTPQTTYAENMGVMAITRVFSSSNFLMAAAIAILLGICPKFGAVIRSIPNPVLGGVTLILYGLIALMGVKIWMDAKVDFADHRNMVVAGASLIVATGLGVRGITVGGTNIAGIAVGTVLALVMHAIFRIKPRGRSGGSVTQAP
jgi:putative pyrimidine permease RutG